MLVVFEGIQVEGKERTNEAEATAEEEPDVAEECCGGKNIGPNMFLT